MQRKVGTMLASAGYLLPITFQKLRGSVSSAIHDLVRKSSMSDSVLVVTGGTQQLSMIYCLNHLSYDGLIAYTLTSFPSELPKDTVQLPVLDF